MSSHLGANVDLPTSGGSLENFRETLNDLMDVFIDVEIFPRHTCKSNPAVDMT